MYVARLTLRSTVATINVIFLAHRKMSVHFTFIISRDWCYEKALTIEASCYCSVRQEISSSVCLRLNSWFKFH